MFLNCSTCFARHINHHSGNLQAKTYVKPEAAITVFELLMMGGVSPETCWANKKHWNNTFYYTVASCWFFLWDLILYCSLVQSKSVISLRKRFCIICGVTELVKLYWQSQCGSRYDETIIPPFTWCALRVIFTLQVQGSSPNLTESE
jgi:hypothetical protein